MAPPTPPAIPPRHQDQASLSFSQESLWFLQQLDPYNNAYHSTYLLKFTGGVNPRYLELALNELVRRHEPLRTLYPNQGGKPVQVIQPFQPFSLPQVDFSSLPEKERQGAVQAYLTEHSNQPFDLHHGPSFRLALLHQAPGVDILFFCTHHVNSDAWSRQIFFRELTQAYEAFRRGSTPSLPDLPVQYSDYATWQREWLSGNTLAAYIDHWKTILGGDLPVLQLPTDRPRPAMQSYRGIRYYFQIPRDISSRVKQFCQIEHLTPFQLLLSAYALLLMRYSGQEDIILGCPFANRARPELDGLMGLFVNTLPIRVKLSGNPSTRTFLRQIQALMLEAYPWQAAPFEALVSEISPERNLSRSPIFQVTINMRNVPKQQAGIEGLEIESFLRLDAPGPFDLSLEFDTRTDGSLDASLQYNPDLFDEATILHMVAHYQNLLAGILAGCDSPVSDLEMLTPFEKRHLLVDWNNTARDFRRQDSLQVIFEAQAANTPQAPAVAFGSNTLNYAELNRKANQLARHLLKLGVGRGIPVGLCMERSPDMVVAMLAIIKAGGAYVPLDPAYPPGRLEFMVRDTGIQVVVSLDRWVDTLPAGLFSGLKLVRMDSQADEISQHEAENPPCLAEPQDVAYIIYTSGSTGTPKGICIPQRAINRLVWNTDYIQLSSHDRVAQASSMSFDAATFEVWGALLHGACLVGIPQETLLSPLDLRQAIREQGIQVMFLTTALFNQVASIAPDAFATLRCLLFGGEAVTPSWVRQVLQAGPPQHLVHVYGPTETTTFATWQQVREVAEDAVTVPIGKPIANTSAYVLDKNLHPVPVGVTGELYLGGPGLAVGYHNRPELSSERFIPNPFRNEEKQAGFTDCDRLYRSGDLVRFKPDGSIEFVGRTDNQVKIRGFRIELGEIEAAIRQFPGVQQVTLLVRTDQPGEKRLVAYLVPSAGAGMDLEALREHLRARLPTYMLPAAFLILESFPLTANGKVDLHALPSPDYPLQEQHYLAPRNEIETRLVAIWKDVLGVEQVGVQDDFFELGGHSLMAVRLFERIESEFGQSLPLMMLFKNGTIEAISQALEDKEGHSPPQGIAIIRPEGTQTPLFIISASLYMRDLVTLMPPGRALYGLDPVQNGKKVFQISIQETAGIYYRNLVDFYPQGPYMLLGHSANGLFALEIARLLIQNNKEVTFLGLLDTLPPGAKKQARFTNRVMIHIKNLQGKNPAQVFQYIGRSLRTLMERTRRGMIIKTNKIEDYGKVNRDKEDMRILLMDAYNPEPYPGKVTLFAAAERPWYMSWDPLTGWKDFITGQIETVLTPGDHMTMLDMPNAAILAARLDQLLPRS